VFRLSENATKGNGGEKFVIIAKMRKLGPGRHERPSAPTRGQIDPSYIKKITWGDSASFGGGVRRSSKASIQKRYSKSLVDYLGAAKAVGQN